MAQKKIKIAVSLTPEIVSRLKSVAPGGNLSRHLDGILRDYFNFDPEMNADQNDQEIEDVIKYYRREKMLNQSDKHEQGYKMGVQMVMDKSVPFPVLSELAEARRLRDSQRHLTFRDPWYRINNDELFDILSDLTPEHGGSEEYLKGFFEGVYDRWEKIEKKI